MRWLTSGAAMSVLAATLSVSSVFAGPLHDAVRIGDEEKVRQLISDGADVNSGESHAAVWWKAAMLRITLRLAMLLALTVPSARGDHVELPDGVTPVMATWLWGYHVVPGAITKDGSPRLYSYPHTDASRINDPSWTDVAAKHMKAGAKAPAILLMHGCAGVVRGAIGHHRLQP